MTVRVELGGERFSVEYRIAAAGEREARRRAEDICVEQTVEYPADLLPAGDIPRQVVGRVEALVPSEGAWEARLSFAVETAGGELTQLLNVCFGNISLVPGLRLQRLCLPDSLLCRFAGPRFGRDGLRRLLAAPRRPLLCSALKPMGLGPAALAQLAHDLAAGGLDLVKDDHGLADQPFCRFEDRVLLCADAVARANRETGASCLYAPNVTAPADLVTVRARLARDAGAGALLFSPGLAGLDAMRLLAEDHSLGLPLLFHPALLGSFVVSPDSGISHHALFGQIPRLFGADAVIFPHAGGRFSFSEDECRSLAAGTAAGMGRVAPCFPVPAGGMSLGRVPEICAFYGPDVMLLIGGDLHRGAEGLTARCRRFRELVEAM